MLNIHKTGLGVRRNKTPVTMNEEQDNLESENQDNGGETVDKQTTEKAEPDYKQIAEDQRKRAEKAEAKLKEPKDEQIKPAPTTDADELRLIAKGLSDEEIDQAKVIAKGMGSNLAEAIKSPLFTAFQKDMKEQQRRDKAKLNASKGSEQELQQQRKSLTDMTPAEQKAERDAHQKAAMEMAQNIR